MEEERNEMCMCCSCWQSDKAWTQAAGQLNQTKTWGEEEEEEEEEGLTWERSLTATHLPPSLLPYFWEGARMED